MQIRWAFQAENTPSQKSSNCILKFFLESGLSNSVLGAKKTDTETNKILIELKAQKGGFMNSKLNTVAEVSAMLMGLSEVELESVKVYIATLSAVRSVSAPTTPVEEVAPTPVVADAPKADTATIKTRKVSAPTVTEPAMHIDNYADYKLVGEYDADRYHKVTKAIGASTKKGSALRAARGLVYAVMDGKVSESDAAKLVAQYKQAQGWV